MLYTKDTHKGIFRPLHPEKYLGNPRNIIYRSGYELKFMKRCDQHSSVLAWGSEEVMIPYRSPVDNRIHRYYVDFIVQFTTPDGEIKTHLIEVKPEKFTQPPKPQKRKTKRFISEVVQWGINNAKWEAARLLAEEKGWKFSLVTERDLKI